MIAPDGTFKDVPIGMDPTQWPLDVDVAKTTKAAQDNPLYPGGQFTVYGDFCWSGDKTRAESYFIPAGTQPEPAQTNSRDPAVAKKAMQQLQAEHMLGTAIAAGDTYVTFTVPDDDKVLDGAGDNTVARLVVYDNKAHRASAIDAKTVLSLKATKKPLSLPLIGGIAGLADRHHAPRPGASARRAAAERSAAEGHLPRRSASGLRPAPRRLRRPPGGYGGPPAPLRRYGASAGVRAIRGARRGRSAWRPSRASRRSSRCPRSRRPARLHYRFADSGAGPPPIVQVRCPACGMITMATSGQPSFCFSCGQPIAGEHDEGRWGRLAPPGFPFARTSAR